MNKTIRLTLKAEVDWEVISEVSLDMNASILELEREWPFGVGHAISEKLAPKLVKSLFTKGWEWKQKPL